MTRLVVLGGGRMGSALVEGLMRSGWAGPEECTVVERRPEQRAVLTKRFPGLKTSETPVPGDALVLAVKPVDVEAVCRSFAPESWERILSVVAGATIGQLESWLWGGARVVRAMPNTPALLGTSASAVAPGNAATDEDLEWAESVLSAIGVVVRLPERLLDAATGLSGAGPAYIYLVAEALVEAGVLEGLDREVAKVLVSQTILGAARMLVETGESAEALRGAVTSPGGVTAAGLRELERYRVRSAFLEAVDVAVRRSKELSAGL